MAVLNGVKSWLAEVDTSVLASLACALLFGYWVVLIVYRRYFHPLSHIPGPWLATTQLYQLYYDYVLGGKFFLELERLHKVYGPVVRIGPNEVHLTDPSNYDKIYFQASKFGKDPGYYDAWGIPNSMFSIASNEIHRTQRAAVNPYFSRRAVLNQEALIQEKAVKLCDRVDRETSLGIPSWVQQAFRALSMDVISEYGYGKDNGYNFLDSADLGEWWNEMLFGLNRMVLLLLLCPSLGVTVPKVMDMMPRSLGKMMNPIFRSLLSCIEKSEKMLDMVEKELEAGVQREEETIFHALIQAGQKGEIKGVEVTRKYLTDETFAIFAAAVETAGNVMSVGAYHVIKNPEMYARLHQELKEAFPDENEPMSYLELEKLPYLTAVVKEAMRRSYPVIHSLPRSVPEGGAEFNGYYLPEGAAVGMSAWFLHRHPDAFPDPEKFDPGRWLDPEDARFREHYLAPFSRGNRACLGQNLATCEVYIALARLFRRFDDLCAPDTSDKDMEYDGYFTGFHPAKSRRFTVSRRQKA